jgi:hypothetical protein
MIDFIGGGVTHLYPTFIIGYFFWRLQPSAEWHLVE